MAGKKVTYQLKNGILTVNAQGTLHTFLSEEEKRKIKRIIISEGCSRIGGWVFTGCENVTDVILPVSLRIIAENAFRGCSHLKNIVLPECLVGLSEGAFRSCVALESMVLPKNVHTLPRNVFRDCTGMKKLVLPEGILRIEPCALLGCEAEILFHGELVLIQDDMMLRKDTREVIRHFMHGNGAVDIADNRLVHDDILGSFPGTKLKAYDTHVCNWNQQGLVCGIQYEITVRSPFCRRVGDSFWSAFQNNQFVKARLMSIMAADKFSARIRVMVVDIVNWIKYVRPVSEEKKKYLQKMHCYEVRDFSGDLDQPFCRQISEKMIEVYNVWDGGDFQFLDYIYTDDDGIDHHVIGKYGGRVYVGDNVLGYHKYFPYPVNR